MRETIGSGAAWVPPETPSGVVPAGPVAWPTAAVALADGSDDAPGAAGLPGAELLGGSAGAALARGDARVPRRTERIEGGGAASLERNPLAQLSVQGPGAVLDGAIGLLRFRFWRLVALTAVLFVPVRVLTAWVSLRAGLGSPSESDGGGAFLSLGQVRGVDDGTWSVVLLGLHAIALCLLGMAVGHLVAAWLEGRDPTVGETLLAVARRCWVAPVVTLITAAAKVPLTCFFGVGFFLADAVFFVAGVVAGAELLGPIATVRRCVRLTRPAYGVALVVVIGGWVITQVLQIVLTAGPLLLVSFFAPPEGWYVVGEQLASLVLLFALPLTACIAGRAYVDLRCRTEGFDLVLRQVDRGLG